MNVRNVHSVLVQNATFNATKKACRYATADIAVTSSTSSSCSPSSSVAATTISATYLSDGSANDANAESACTGLHFRQTSNRIANRMCSTTQSAGSSSSGSSSISILLAPFFYTILIVMFCLFLVLVYHCTELPSFKVLALDLSIHSTTGAISSDDKRGPRSTLSSPSARVQKSQTRFLNQSTTLTHNLTTTTTKKVKIPATATTSGASQTLYPSDRSASTVRQYRSIRSGPSANPLPSIAQAQIRFPTFTILAILPEENAPPIIRALRDSQAKWEISGVQSTSPLAQHQYNKLNKNRFGQSSSPSSSSSSYRNHQVPPSKASDVPLMIFSEPANNDTERLLNSMCQWINVHSPMMILSLLEQQRNYYASTVADAVGIPFVSLTQNYRNEIDELIGDSVAIYQQTHDNGYSNFDRNSQTNNDDPTIQQRRQNSKNSNNNNNNHYSNFQNSALPSSSSSSSSFSYNPSASHNQNIKLSLDVPIQTLADATFELLRAQYWFDAILIVDDSIVSDLFARRLSSLCRMRHKHKHPQQQSDYHQQWRREPKQQKPAPHFQSSASSSWNKFDRDQYDLDPSTMPWMNPQESGLKISPFRVDVLNSESELDGHRVSEREFQGKTFSDNSKLFEFRKSREASLLDVWKNLNVIRLSRSLVQNEFFLRMAEIQTTHRRVVLVHCDWATTKRVMDTARELDLFNGDKIWILLDGLLESSNTFESESFAERLHLPMGMLALRNRHRNVGDSAMLDSIVELLGKAALNLYHGKFYPDTAIINQTRSSNTKSKSPFSLAKLQLPSGAFLNSKISSSSPFLASSSQSTTPLHNVNNGGCQVANYTDPQLEHRFGILSELRKLVDTILARYRKSPIKRCNSLHGNGKSRSSSNRRSDGGRRLKKNAAISTSSSSSSPSSSAQHQNYFTSSNRKPIQSDIKNVDINNDDYNLINKIRKYNLYNYFDFSVNEPIVKAKYSNDKVGYNYENSNEYDEDYDENYEDDDDDDNDKNEEDKDQPDSSSLHSMYQSIVPQFELLNLVPRKQSNRHQRQSQEPFLGSYSGDFSSTSSYSTLDQSSSSSIPYQRMTSKWRTVGNVSQNLATVNTIVYIGSEQVPNYVLYDGKNVRPDFQGAPGARPLMYMTNSGKHRFRVATNIAPPFVIESTKLDNNTCLTGDFCLKIQTNVRDDLIEIFTDFRSQRRRLEGKSYQVKCCAGIAIDLLNAVARDLHFDYDLYLVADGLFGVRRDGKWDGVTADLVNDLAHLSFTAFSTTSSRVQSIDYSIPFFYSGVSCLSMSSNYTDVPLLAFLIPFSYELWAAIFASLLATAIAAAIYEWFSPFGLNPWGRQRTKNFSLASALWVMCSLLFSHLVAFKAPKSWPNKVLINVWGAFSVIFLATYTANIAAHFAGLFLVPEVNNFRDSSLMKQRTGTARSSASEGYLMEKYTDLWHHIQHYKVDSFDEGLEHLRNGKLDVLIGDTAILDYFRATDPGCNLRLLGDSIFDDAYAVGMQKGFPFRESISNLILQYNEFGFLDQLHRKWYGRVHCFQSSSPTKPKPLTIRAVAGVFLMLGFGIVIGILILFAEHFVFKYILPSLRKKSKDCVWKSPNLMFFSQKLYRFINTVELVSPHHSAKEIVANLREGQIASLFQKSVKRKAKEEARRRKSKSQFFEMIQEVRKVVQRQQHERSLQEDDEVDGDIDEEAALNTDANVKATKPPLSMLKDNSFLDSNDTTVSNTRISAIRFKEPSAINNDDQQTGGRQSTSKKRTSTSSSGTGHQPLVSRLKTTAQSSYDRPTSRTGYTSVCGSSGDDELDNDRDYQSTNRHTRPQHYHPRRYREGTGATKSRRKTLQKSHLSSVSFSLENIFFEGLLSEGVSDPSRARATNGRRRRILSFEDLPEIKKELSESSNETYDYYGSGSQQRSITPTSSSQDVRTSSHRPHHHHHHPHHHSAVSYVESLLDSPVKSPTSNGQSTFNRITKSNTTPASLTSTGVTAANAALPTSFSSSRYFDRISGGRNAGGSNLSKNDILVLWRSSERELLNRLQDSLEQKRALEEKVALLQRMLMKPP